MAVRAVGECWRGVVDKAIGNARWWGVDTAVSRFCW
jgi:hypothetical protein